MTYNIDECKTFLCQIMINLSDIVSFCDNRVRRKEIADFPGAENGLQVANDGKVTKIGASVDAGLIPFQKAIEAKIDFLIVHHGLFWRPFTPITEDSYEKIKLLIKGNLAVYASHLPLDGHREIGNNALIAKALGLGQLDWFLEFQGTKIGLIAEAFKDREELKLKLRQLFPGTFTAIEFGSGHPKKIAISSGSGNSVVGELLKAGVDTLVTGELRQHHFNMAQELKLNLYACGHYATEVFGVQALAKEVARKFNLDYEFIQTECPL